MHTTRQGTHGRPLSTNWEKDEKLFRSVLLKTLYKLNTELQARYATCWENDLTLDHKSNAYKLLRTIKVIDGKTKPSMDKEAISFNDALIC